MSVGVQVRHKNGNGLDNRLENILIGNCVDNSLDRLSEERRASSARAALSTRKFSYDDAIRLRYLRSIGAPISTLAYIEGVSSTTLRKMFDGKSYRDASTFPSPDDVIRLRYLKAVGCPISILADMEGVSPKLLSKMLDEKSCKDVPTLQSPEETLT